MMQRILLFLISSIASVSAFAEQKTLSFAPPPSDYSVVFLGNIFGSVDGVLHGSGSQIMGVMFGVFNSAVLALGGIIIMYTLLVSTLNTAQEGQMLGQKWSSIWVPMRSTLGLALLIPKASGYCLMQIFMMWIVVQGVGAADKVWEAALSYLNRGGMIVQTQVKPLDLVQVKSSEVVRGAGYILSAQVCMLGLQKILEQQREVVLDKKRAGAINCDTPGGSDAVLCRFAETPVPDLLNSANFVTAQRDAGKGAASFQVSFPSLATGNDYASLNGVCGTLSWNPLQNLDQSLDNRGTKGGNTLKSSFNANELETINLSRAIGIQQMYVDLSLVAQVMVNNNPAFDEAKRDSESKPATPYAKQPYGFPLLKSGAICNGVSADCTNWGNSSGNNATPLLSGVELQGAVADYNGIMLPTLTLMQQSKDADLAMDYRKFLVEAKSRGWIMAGSYFFDLAKLTKLGVKAANLQDTDIGWAAINYDLVGLTTQAEKPKQGECTTDLCTWLNGDSKLLQPMFGMLDGRGIGTPLSWTGLFADTGNQTGFAPVEGPGASTVFGFIKNGQLVQLPGQPGLEPPKFQIKFNYDMAPGVQMLPEVDFPCERTMFVCLGQILGNVFYNLIIRNLFNFLLSVTVNIIKNVVMAFLSLPLLGMAEIFKYGVSFIQQPNVNPIVALANMGVAYINFANELWIYLLILSISTIIIPLFGIFVIPLLTMAMPLIIAWVGTMLTVGFTTAYYVPMLPYMMFTFGSIAWLMSVIEAMVAAPIVALGVTHPEGHDAFGKGEQAIMIIMNVFLRPSMMIIGYVAGIALSYVSVWVLNAGFSNAISFMSGDGGASFWQSYGASEGAGRVGGEYAPPAWDNISPSKTEGIANYHLERASTIDMTRGYTGWAGIYAYFFSILIYTTMYIALVQKAFSLIAVLPDKILRWIGGQPESIGQEGMQWAEEGKQQISQAGGETAKAASRIDSKLAGGATQGMQSMGTGNAPGGEVSGSEGGGKPKPPAGGGASSTPS